jgi:hypothetical protein
MTGRSLSRRLELLEERIIPADEPTSFQIILVDSDGTRTPTGVRIEMPPPGRTRGAKKRLLNANPRCRI